MAVPSGVGHYSPSSYVDGATGSDAREKPKIERARLEVRAGYAWDPIEIYVPLGSSVLDNGGHAP